MGTPPLRYGSTFKPTIAICLDDDIIIRVLRLHTYLTRVIHSRTTFKVIIARACAQTEKGRIDENDLVRFTHGVNEGVLVAFGVVEVRQVFFGGKKCM